jgi:hypothetical protein
MSAKNARPRRGPRAITLAFSRDLIFETSSTPPTPNTTMPRADCPPGAWLSAVPARLSAPDCRCPGEASSASATPLPGSTVVITASTARSGARTQPDDCARLPSLPASARTPRGGAVWPPPLAPRRCPLVASAVARRGRCSPNAGARLRREDPGSALPIPGASV